MARAPALLLVAVLLATGLVACTPAEPTSPKGISTTCDTVKVPDAADCRPPKLLTAGGVREAWRTVLTGGREFDSTSEPYSSAITRLDRAAETPWNDLSRDGTEPWADLDTGRVTELITAFRRVKAMALAWSTHGSAVEGNEALLADTIAATQWLLDNRFNASTEFVPLTWWYWQIGIPLEVNDITVLLYDHLSTDQVSGLMDAVHHFSPEVTGTGANRIWMSMVVGVRGAIMEDRGALLAARDGATPALQIAETGDGFHADGSFIQHSYFSYTGAYGTSFIRTLGKLTLLLHGSPWEITNPGISNLAEWVTKAFDPVIYRGVMMDAVRGREISRETAQNHKGGATAMRAALMLAVTASPDNARTMRAIVKRWILEDPLGDFWTAGTLTDLHLGWELIYGDPVAPSPRPTGMWAFNAMDRAVFQGGDFAYSVSMSSSRIATHEVVSGENLHGWYTAYGMTALYTGEKDQFGDGYWATVNPFRLPGTTVDTIARSAGEGSHWRPDSNFAGSLASASAHYGVAGMQLEPYLTDTTANKAWFFFDNEMVALGSGITSRGQVGTGWDGSPRHVETIIDDRRLVAGQVLTVDDDVIEPGEEKVIADPEWAHLSGEGAQVGYVLPDSSAVSVYPYTGAGTWHDINAARGTDDIQSNDFAALWINHGANPTGDKYAYIVLPDASESETRAYAARPEVTVLENTSSVSAVLERHLGAIGAVFWKDQQETLRVDGEPFLTVDSRAQVTTEESAEGVRLTLMDPTQAHDGLITVELDRTAAAVDFVSPGVTVTQLSPSIIFTVDVTDAAGAGFRANFSYAPPPPAAQ